MLQTKHFLFSSMFSKKTDELLKLRLWLYGFAEVHLVFLALKLLTIDFAQAEDPRIRVYADVRWKLITSWFNLISLAYFPVCFYCDWKELLGESKQRHVKNLNKIRCLIFTGILFPTTMFSDILFWRLWNKNPLLLAPPNIETYVPWWSQHCLHTVSLVVVILDLILVPRTRPKSMLPGLALLSTFIGLYYTVCGYSIMQGQYVYPVLKTFSKQKMFLLLVYSFTNSYFYYTSQWFITEFFWGCKGDVKKHY